MLFGAVPFSNFCPGFQQCMRIALWEWKSQAPEANDGFEIMDGI